MQKIVILLIILLNILIANENEINLTPEEKNYLKNKNITMCVDPDWEPFEKINENG